MLDNRPSIVAQPPKLCSDLRLLTSLKNTVGAIRTADCLSSSMSTPFRTVSLENGERNSDIFAPNVLVDDQQCPACDRKVDLDKEGISCRSCHLWFHGTNCKASEFIVSKPTNFAMLKHAMSKTSGFADKFGKFVFICDTCETEYEKRSTLKTDDRVSALDNKLADMEKNFDSKFDELKSLITGSTQSLGQCDSFSSLLSNGSLPQSDNAWDNTQRTENMKHLLVFKKDDSGKCVDDHILEKAAIDSGVGIVKKFQLKKSEDTCVMVKSKADADLLKSAMKTAAPDNEPDHINAKLPRIHLVGLKRKYDKADLEEIIKKQNERIRVVCEGDIASEEDKTFEVLAVVPLRKNAEQFKAVLKVSNLIRSQIHKEGDRLFVGLESRCRVYDHFFVLRCYRCQEYGHHSHDCKKDDVCAFCSGIHRTEMCQKKKNPDAVATCRNCKASGCKESEFSHPANSSDCPMLIEHQKRIKQQTPFYRQQM